ncbi:MAG: hypothetical protein FWG43_03190 [Clostridiales bacterium]|nr:hypothetical protein [Clostridiales bacterium]
MKKSRIILVSMIIALVLLMISFTSAMAADPPMGAVNRTITVNSGLGAGTYLVHDGFRNGDYASNNRLISTAFNWDPATMENYVFDPSLFPNIQYHPDGFPLRATYRTPVDHLSEMRYLHQTYPDITNMVLLGRSNGVQTGATHNNWNAFPQYSIPIYALEICSAPGVMDGRPATLHQCGNHGGELDSNELGMNLAWYLCTNYGKLDQVTNLINTTRVYILPYTNPDGNMMSFRAASGNHRTNARGVDPNRNWAYRWGSNTGSSNTPGTGATYRGPSPNSEPEGQAISSVYRMDNVISSVSGHTSGQIVIYAWSYVRNATDGHPLLTKLAKEQTDLNGHTPQNGHVMYAQSGEINDYLWGSMRAMGFTYEYGTGQTVSYLGSSAGENYITCNYLDAAGQPKRMRGFYSSSTIPSTDVTGQLAFLSDEFFALGYQNLTVTEEGNGLNKDPDNPNAVGPLNRRLTLAKLLDELAAGLNVSGKIFMSHIPSTAGADIANTLKAAGAIGWVVVNTTSDGGYGTTTPSYSATGGNFPIASVIKGYAADIHEHAKADPTTTLTFKADRQDFASVNYQWGRHKNAYMHNMSFAVTYANHVKGKITDVKGNLIPETELKASLIIEGKILNTNGTEAPAAQQWKETHAPQYDVVGGEYDWSILPSKQSEYIDKGWDITASAPGGFYSYTTNIKFPVDRDIAIKRGMDPDIFADPMYQQTVNYDFVMPYAVSSDFDFDKTYISNNEITISFTTYTLTGQTSVPGDVENVIATVGGEAAVVTSLGGGKYEANFTVAKSGEYDVVIDFAGGDAHTAYTNDIKFANYQISLVPVTETDLNTGDTLLVDVMLAGDLNYSMVAAEIAYDASLVLYDSYTYLNGWVASVTQTESAVTVRSMPSSNMVTGSSCAPIVKIAQLKFTIRDSFSGDNITTALSFIQAVVNPAGIVTVALTAPSEPLDIVIHKPIED